LKEEDIINRLFWFLEITACFKIGKTNECVSPHLQEKVEKP
jgi:hypothetical protein